MGSGQKQHPAGPPECQQCKAWQKVPNADVAVAVLVAPEQVDGIAIFHAGVGSLTEHPAGFQHGCLWFETNENMSLHCNAF